jgi:hypothetical protein
MLCGSWIIVSIETGKSVFETFSATVANSINTQKYKAVCAYDYLTSLNKRGV